MNIKVCLCSLLFVGCFALNAFGQDENSSEEKIVKDIQAMMPNVQSAYLETLQTILAPNLLASEDGHYAAQNKEELQTYLDLAMSYKYIESPEIRIQLRLDDKEGIIVTDCEKGGEGYRVGFRPNDLVLRVDDESVDTQYDLVQALAAKRGASGSAVVRRDGEIQELTFVLTEVQTEDSERWQIGVSVAEVDELLRLHLDVQGVVITRIAPNTPAEKMGLQVNDIICKINGVDVENTKALSQKINSSKGQSLKIQFLRTGNKRAVELKPIKKEAKSDVEWPANIPLRVRYFQPKFAPTPHKLEINLPRPQTELQMPAIEWSVRAPEAPQGKWKKVAEKLEDLQKQIEELKKSLGK